MKWEKIQIGGKQIRFANFKVQVNYDLRLEERAKSFSFFSEYLTDDRFPSVYKGAVEIETVAIFLPEAGIIHAENAQAAFQEVGIRPATPKELADMSICFPKSRKLDACFTLLAFGSPSNRGGCWVAGLRGETSSREMHTFVWSVKLLEGAFLGVRL